MFRRWNTFFLACSLLFISISTYAKVIKNDRDYLPDVEYDSEIPTPQSVLGYPVGTWHVRHDQLVRYMQVLAEASDRVSLEVTGYTHEQRPLLLLTITGQNNRANLDAIRSTHLDNIESGKAAAKDAPLMLYMGYSVHGNEPSGSNAALLVAYYLAAAKDERVSDLLDNTVILLDPSLNPDGLSRFAQWANMHKGYNLVADPVHREHREHWPSGRTNHYWFDLNRDWLLLTHPESQARVAQFHKWRPHILTDFHEMGTNSTYFFQPGVPTRKNPWTPETNVTLTNELAKFHARALDADGQLYFTEERFDDFYFGKGSTYPDVHGSIGILFEQASSRGHLQDSINGPLAFTRTILNQFTTTLSTFDGALANKTAILAYQRQFHRDTAKLIDEDDTYGFVVKQPADKTRFERMLSILDAHQISYSFLESEAQINNKTFEAAKSIFIPLNQVQYRVIRSIFSERKSFVDNTFYDVSNWNIGFAFNVEYAAVERSSRRKIKLSDSAVEHNMQLGSVGQDTIALAYEWHDYNAPRLTQTLLNNGVKLRVSSKVFTADTSEGKKTFAAGTVVVPSSHNNLVDVISSLPTNSNIKVHQITFGLTQTGVDLGSPSIEPIKNPRVLLVGGRGTSQYEVGEIWHYLDTRIGLPASLVDLNDLSRINFDNYSHIIFASGSYNGVAASVEEKLGAWVQNGGVLIGQRTALRWFDKNDWISNQVVSNDTIDNAFETEGLSFADKDALRAQKLVAGAAFNVAIDLTHPLFFGFENTSLPMFKTTNLVLEQTDNPFEDIAMYTESSLLGGYAAPQMQDLIDNSVAVAASQKGRGVVIAFVDNIHFRGYWDGTNKLMANAIFMSPLMN